MKTTLVERMLGLTGVSFFLMAAVLLLGSFGLGARADAYTSVSGTAYDVGSVTCTPAHTVPGRAIHLQGAGQVAGYSMDVMIMGKDPNTNEVYYKELGKTTSDASGNWSYDSAIPSTITRDSDKSEVAIMPGSWPVGSYVFADDGGVYRSLTYVQVDTSSGSGGSGSSGGSSTLNSDSLPTTGMTAAAILSVLGGASLIIMGVRIRRERLRLVYDEERQRTEWIAY